MIKNYLVLTVLLFSLSVHASVAMHLDFHSPKVKQGHIESATIKLDETAIQNVELQKLVGSSWGDSIYLYSVGPLLRKNGEANYQSEAKVIFLKSSVEQPLIHKINENEIQITWSNVEVIPTEAPKELIFGQFEIPSRKKIVIWLSGLLFALLGTIAVLKYRKTVQNKKYQRKKKIELKNKVISATEYSQVVQIWQEKATILKVFPQLSEPFKTLETVLFKYQFKPSQMESEKAEVMTAYRTFVEQVQGGFDGV